MRSTSRDIEYADQPGRARADTQLHPLPDFDLSLLRLTSSLLATAVLIYGFVWDV